ncbi:MAG: hypothetical protein HY329_04135 [Chloroflexi bacterium]|nr:hypothetical protein [Chloroflexota bacterium]
MGTFQDMAQDNPNIRQQYDEWRGVRSDAGQDAADWRAFREHVQALGAPEPGMLPPDDWVGDDFKEANPDWQSKYQE